MLFNSYAFLCVFLPCVIVGSIVLAPRAPALAAGWLLAASLAFYGWWDARYVPLLLLSIGFNYWCGETLAKVPQTKSQRRKLVLSLAIGFDLLLLGYFKYAGFLVANTSVLLATQFDFQSSILPLGISFFTFTQIAYLVDIYRAPTRYAPVPYALFVAYFPHLIAGPILHHREMMPQFTASNSYRLNPTNLSAAVRECLL